MRWGWSIALVCALCAPSLRPVLAQVEAQRSQNPAGDLLREWERASSGLLGVGPLEFRRMYYLHGSDHSAHELAVLNEFRGPVSAAELTQRFEWSVKETAQKIDLIGTPTDDVERMFYEELSVTIDPKTHLPKNVAFSGARAGKQSEPLAVVLSPRIDEPNRFPLDPSAKPILVASRNEDAPPRSPIRVVQHITREAIIRPELPTDVEHALQVWETAAGQVRSLHANVKRYTYETQSHVEHRAIGEFSFAAPQEVQCTLKPAPIAPHAESHRRTSDGAAYELLPSPAETWEYTPAEIRFSHHSNQPVWVLSHNRQQAKRIRTVSKADPRAAGKEEQIVPPWPMLFHPKAAELAKRFDIRVSDHPHLATWEFSPRELGDIGGFQVLRVLLEKATHLPRAVQIMNHAGDVEMVYTFQYTQVQRKTALGIEPELLPVKPDVPKREPAPTALHGLP